MRRLLPKHPPEIRAQANKECEAFVHAHIRDGKSAAAESTLRTPKALDEAIRARQHGFYAEMTYVATDDVEINIERGAIRAS